MHVGHALFEIVRAAGARSVFVVGTGKNVGKTVAMRSIYGAATEYGMHPGLTSIGRDGEAIDIGDARSKPRLFLRPGTLVGTARDVLPRSPASEIVDLSKLQTAAGQFAYARVKQPAFFELVGPPTASGIREARDRLLQLTDFAIVDGAIDRIAALAGGDDAIVIACGASAAPTMDEAVADVRALVQRLTVPSFDGRGAYLRIEGALTPSIATAFINARETRAIVVRDPTQIALTGRAAIHALERLTIRSERSLRVAAITVASIGRERSFEPRAFAGAVAVATGLPTFDVYAGKRAA